MSERPKPWAMLFHRGTADREAYHIGPEDLQDLMREPYPECPENEKPTPERLLAALNACAGIPTEALEGADVGALVEALASARGQLRGYHEEAYGEDYNDPRINAALAPFLKGGTDD